MVITDNRVSRATMSLDLPLVSLVMYLQEGEINTGDEGKGLKIKCRIGDKTSLVVQII
jgi:hypothetical protein